MRTADSLARKIFNQVNNDRSTMEYIGRRHMAIRRKIPESYRCYEYEDFLFSPNYEFVPFLKNLFDKIESGEITL